MGRLYKFLGLTVGVIQNHTATASAGSIWLRRHLRHQQRVRLRLPPRQHEVRFGVDGAARPVYRHRRTRSTRSDRRSRVRRSINQRPSEERPDKYYLGRPDRPAAWSKRRIIRSTRSNTRPYHRGGRASRGEAPRRPTISYDPDNMDTLHAVQQALRATRSNSSTSSTSSKRR